MATSGDGHEASHSQYSIKNEWNESLGFTYENPKFPEYSEEAKRRGTLQQLSSDHPIEKENLSEAGFFKDYEGNITGYFCGGSIKKWERGEDARIEHARHFPKCGFLKLKFGQRFIDAVQELVLDEKRGQITVEMVENKMGVTLSRFSQDYGLKRHSASECDAMTRARSLTESGHTLSAPALQGQFENEGRNGPGSDPENDTDDIERKKQLEEENAELRRKVQCMVCKDKKRSVCFDPCQHLVCCIECGPRQENCPGCDQPIKARVAAKM